MRRLLHAVAREPLVHFLALGALIFGTNAALHRSTPVDDHRITIAKADIERLRALYTQQWGAAPGDGELPRLVENYVRAEVLFREGSALGLDADDAVLRNRIIQKMEFLIQDPSAVPEPSAAELATYYLDHQDRYRIPAQVAFTHIYFSPSLRGTRAQTDARAVRAGFKAAPGRSTAPARRGDPCMVPADVPLRAHDQVEQDFGSAFADAVFTLPVGTWEGPIASALGLHLVRLVDRAPSSLPQLSEIEDHVRADVVAAHQQRATETAYARLRARYQVLIDPGAFGADGSIAAVTVR